ncbi:MAG: InlB B-repeat-containing protein, partial [Erysipelotrichaceae bacterium]|nr:InlB B-repeat-containing protein [Erysipelotrichaceae bacterium]
GGGIMSKKRTRLKLKSNVRKTLISFLSVALLVSSIHFTNVRAEGTEEPEQTPVTEVNQPAPEGTDDLQGSDGENEEQLPEVDSFVETTIDNVDFTQSNDQSSETITETTDSEKKDDEATGDVGNNSPNEPEEVAEPEETEEEGTTFADGEFIGDIEQEEDIPDAGQMAVKVTYVYSDDRTFAAPETNMAYVDADKTKYEGSFNIPTIPAGYTVDLKAPVTGVTLEGGVLNVAVTDLATKSISVTVVYTAQPAAYTVKTYFMDTNGEYPSTPDEIRTKQGTVDETTEIEPASVDGFTAMPVSQQIIAADGSTVVEVKYVRNQYYITYNSNGGSYIAPIKGYYESQQTVYGKTTTTDPICGYEEHTHIAATGNPGRNKTSGCYKSQWSGGPVSGSYKWVLDCTKTEHTHGSSCYGQSYTNTPTKQGYKFVGWYSDEALTTPAPEKITSLTDNVTVYAKWEAQTATYRIVYMSQVYDKNAPGERSYVFHSSTTATGVVGQQTNASFGNLAGTGDNNDPMKYSKNGHIDNTEIKADGTATAYVYYDLIEYTIKFTANNRTIKGQPSPYSFTAVFGEDITDKWPALSDVSQSSGQNPIRNWTHDRSVDSSSNYASKRYVLSASEIPASGTTMNCTASFSNFNKSTTRYFFQDPDDSTKYVEDEKYRETATASLSQKDIAGFTKNTSKSKQTANGNDYYYDRIKYTVTFVNGTAIDNTVNNVPFGKNIANLKYEPTKKPADVDAEATFG